MSAAGPAAAWAGLALGGAVLGGVVMLFNRVAGPALEISRYADDIEQAAGGIARNLEPASAVARTRELALAVPELATGYLERLERR